MSTDPTPPVTRPDDDWQRAYDHCGWIAPTLAQDHIRAMLARGQAAEAERDALWVLAQLEVQAYEEMVTERAQSEEELCDCKLCQAVRGLPPVLRARLAQEDGQ